MLGFHSKLKTKTTLSLQYLDFCKLYSLRSISFSAIFFICDEVVQITKIWIFLLIMFKKSNQFLINEVHNITQNIEYRKCSLLAFIVICRRGHQLTHINVLYILEINKSIYNYIIQLVNFK